MKLSKIKANPNNPRVIRDANFEKLKQSIQDFPKMMALRPMVVDNDGIVLGGNMRLKALQEIGYKDIPDEWVRYAADLTEEEKRRFIVADNLGFGEWDWEAIANEWDVAELESWGLDVPGYAVDVNKFDDKFTLASGDKPPFQQMTFTFADEQAEVVKNALADVKQSEGYKYTETFGNENSNANALYLIITEWAEQKTY